MDDRSAPTDWLLTKRERGNPFTSLDDRYEGDRAWSEGNLVRPLVHGATYFAELCERIEATRKGDLVYFTDWQGNADQQLTEDPDSTVSEVLGRADERGVDVRGLVWRSHREALGFSGGRNLRLGSRLQQRGAEVLLDMRVRLGGSHHQKLVVIRHRGDPTRDVAYVGGIDLCHSRRDDASHRGDPQPVGMAVEYGATPPWHDIQAAISGPAVFDVETVFRERWCDPTPLSRSPKHYWRRWRGHLDVRTDLLPDQAPPPPPVEGGTHVVQLLRTYPNLTFEQDPPAARGGERSVARGYTKAVSRARRLIYVEDQYLWGRPVGNVFSQALRAHPELHVIAVLPRYTDQAGALARNPQLLGRRLAMLDMMRAAPERVAVYSPENHQGTPVYVHAKACVIDDVWATIGSDNFNRRSWMHDTELSAVVVDTEGDYARTLRLTLAAEHLDRDPDEPGSMQDCRDPVGMFDAFARSADALDAWYVAGQVGPRPAGRLRRLPVPELGRFTRALASPPYRWLHDPDGRPRRLRRADEL